MVSRKSCLSSAARTAIEDGASEVCVSAASPTEIATKYRIGRLPLAESLALGFEAMVNSQGFGHLPISLRHAQFAGLSTISHKDPFDRLLIAQAQIEAMTLVSNEIIFDDFEVRRLW